MIIENQQSQYESILDGLKNVFDLLPQTGEYTSFADCVRVWVNEEYPSNRRDKSLKQIERVIEGQGIELILMDHILGGPFPCLKGIDLAKQLNGKRKISNTVLPILFISKTEHSEHSRIAAFEEYQEQFPGSSNWIFKGYFGDSILKPEFVKKVVRVEIEKLLGESPKNKLIEILDHEIIRKGQDELVLAIKANAERLKGQVANGAILASNEMVMRLGSVTDKNQMNRILKEIMNGK
ncbi:MAG: hypothetical protein ABL999_07490 [Pyrinomonadaceae bacterium]